MHEQQSFDWDSSVMADKRCTKCGIVKALSEYHKDKRLSSGLQSACKECKNAVAAQWRRDNPAKVKAHWANWAKNPENQARMLEYTLAYRQKNRDTYVRRSREWYRANLTRAIEQSRSYVLEKPWVRKMSIARWAKKNPHKIRSYSAKRKVSKKSATPAWASQEQIAEFYFAADFLGMVTGEWYHVDHIVPIQGPRQKSGPFNGERLVYGLHCEANLQVMLGKENVKKSNRVWPDMPI